MKKEGEGKESEREQGTETRNEREGRRINWKKEEKEKNRKGKKGTELLKGKEGKK